MGKRKGNSGNAKGGNQHKKQKYNNGRRFWIGQCKTRKIPKSIPSHLILPLVISRVELTDDHMHAGKSLANYLKAEDKKVDTDVDAEQNDGGSMNSHVEDPAPKVEINEAEKLSESDTKANSKQGSDAKDAEDEKDIQSEVKRDPFVQIIRAVSAQGKPKVASGMKEKELPDGDCGDGIKNPFSKDEVPNKYWAQRKRLFSKYDDGIQLDKESWYSVTPEAIATHIAKRISAMTKEDGKKRVILDAFCGVGGNGIAFALHEDVSLVICVDIDRKKLKMAANNASKYGVDPSKLLFVEGNAIEVLKMYSNGSNTSSSTDANCAETCHGYTIAGYQKLPPSIDSVFLSPPWGGVEYLNSGNDGFTLAACIKIKAADDEESDGKKLLALAAAAAKNKGVIYFLPKNINGFDIGLAAWATGYRNVEMEQNYLNGKLKTITVYLQENQ